MKKKSLSSLKLAQESISCAFRKLQKKCDLVMEDGILNCPGYAKARVRILWILKQDYVESGAGEESYAKRMRDAINNGTIQRSPTWRRMSQVSYGILNNVTSFAELPDANQCAEELLNTAVIESNKELGSPRSSTQDIIAGFHKYKDLIFRQIDLYDPNIIIVCMDESLKEIPASIYSHLTLKHEYNAEWGMCASSRLDGKLLLWAYHPSATVGCDGGITDKAYYDAIYTCCANWKR